MTDEERAFVERMKVFIEWLKQKDLGETYILMPRHCRSLNVPKFDEERERQ